MTILFIIVFVTLFVSANCSLYEAVLYSTRMGTLEAARKKKDKRSKSATAFIQLKKNISKPIAAILITNTLANTAGATIAGMYAANVLNPAILPLFSIVFTISILFLAEIMPKNVGAIHWRNLWLWVEKPLRMMNVILSPVIMLTEKFSQLFIRGLKSITITEDEILAMIQIGAREGEISQEESRMVHNMINLENKTVHDIMTPRKVMCSKDIQSTITDFFEPANEKLFTRIPVWEHDKENIIGYIKIQDLVGRAVGAKAEPLPRSMIRPISFIDNSTNCLTAISDFLKHRKHIAVVVDTYDSIVGIVTLEDLVETLVGAEIVDEGDKNADLQKSARQVKAKRSAEKSLE